MENARTNSSDKTEHTEWAGETDVEEGTNVPPSIEKEDYIVDWDGEHDPANPLNWSSGKKLVNLGLVSSLTFITPLASSMLAPAVPRLMNNFDTSNDILASFVVSVYLIGYAFGPLLCAPLSELYGRYWVYQISNVLFVAFTVGCALAPTLGSLIGFRFLAGSAGSAPLVLGGGSVADLYCREQRGSKMSLFVVGPLLGPVIGPVAGAFLAQCVGWRWVFWVITITAGALTIACIIFLRESYAPVLLEQRANQLRKETGIMAYRSILTTDDDLRRALRKAFVRPLKVYFCSPIVFCFITYVAIIFGYLYVLFTTITDVYEKDYGWSTGLAGLSYLGIGVGMVMAIGIFSATSDRTLRRRQRRLKNGEEVPPEVRLEGMIGPAICIPIGMFWYGWSADKHVHWIVPIIGTGWIGLGLIGIFMAVQTYLVDCYPRYAASVTAANTILRSLIAAFLPLAGRPLYNHLGLGWGNSLLGFIALAMVPLPMLFMIYGAHLRKHSSLKLDL